MPVGISGWNSVMGSYYQTWWPKAAIWKAEQEAVKVEARLSYIREVLLKEEQEKKQCVCFGGCGGYDEVSNNAEKGADNDPFLNTFHIF